MRRRDWRAIACTSTASNCIGQTCGVDALNRNGYAGMQRYAAFLWSGDVLSKWETLKTHIPNAINTGLSGIPYWGTDIGGFIPTEEDTWVSYTRDGSSLPRSVRCFVLMAAIGGCISHGAGTPEIWATPKRRVIIPLPKNSRTTRPSSLCAGSIWSFAIGSCPIFIPPFKKPVKTGLPIIRALWLHYADDPQAVGRGDQ